MKPKNTRKLGSNIVIDGGSSNGSIEVIIENESKINQWIIEKDNGVYHAMNKGIAHAKGEYLLFLNFSVTMQSWKRYL